MDIKSDFKRSFLIGGIAFLGLFLLGLGLGHHRLHPLLPVKAHVLSELSKEEKTVKVTLHRMTSQESKRSFGHDLTSRGICPLQVSVHNNTPKTFSLCASSLDLPRVKASSIAHKITRSSIPRAIGYKIASLLFWPFAIPSTIDGVRVLVHHAQVRQDLKAKSLKEEGEIVPPYSTVHRVLFVSQDEMKEEGQRLKVSLVELENFGLVELQVPLE